MSEDSCTPLHQRVYCAAIAAGWEPLKAWDLATSTVERYMMKRFVRMKVGDEIPQVVRYRDAWYTVKVREMNHHGEIGLQTRQGSGEHMLVPITECFKSDERLFFTY